MIRTREIDSVLRTLDVADRDIRADNVPALERLDAILATDPADAGAGLSAVVSAVSRPPSRTRTVRRAGWAAAAVVAAAVALLMVPTMIGDSGRAFAGWTPQPEAMSAAEQSRAAADCRDTLMPHGPARVGYPADAAARMSAATAVVTERRGPWTTVLLTDAAGLWADCVMGPSGGGASDSWDTAVTLPDARGVTLVSEGYGYFAAMQAEYSMIAGAVGSDVTGLAYDSHENGAVSATIMNGYFVLWMPGREWEGGLPAGTAVTVTLADGTSHVQVLTF